MPSKITTQLETPQVNVVSTPKSYDTSMSREFAAQGLEVGSKALADHFDRTNLRNADRDISEAAAGAIAAEQAESDQKEHLLQQMLSADDKVVGKARAELDELRSAREQGLMSGSEREIRVNSLVKWYSNQYPHLGSQIRTLGSQANDNITAAARANSGEDPVEEGRNNLIAEAIERGITPYQLIQEKNLEKQYDLSDKRGKALAYSRNATKEQIYLATSDQLSSYLTNRASGVLTDLATAVKGGKAPHSDQIMALLENARTGDKQQFSRIVNEYQTASGVALDIDQKNAIDKQIDSLYDSLKVQIGALKTTDNITKWANSNSDAILARGRETFTSSTSNLQAQLAATSPEAFNAFISAAIQTDMNRRREITARGGVAAGDEQFATIFKEDPQQMAMLRLAQRGELDDLLAAAIGGVWNNGLPIDTGSTYLDHQTKTITLDMYDRQPFNERSKVTANVVASLDYNEINQSPLLVSDIRSNQVATSLYMEKATRQLMDWVGEAGTRTEMNINLGNSNAPISYKWGTNSSTGVNNLRRINEQYRHIRDNLGSKAAQEWLGVLKELGVKDQTNGNYQFPEDTTPAGGLRQAVGTRTDQPQAKAGGAQLLNYYVTKGEQLGLPASVTRAFARAESSDGTKLKGPDTPYGPAEGIGMIIRPTFDGVNDQYFNGRLVWGDQNDMALASATHLKFLYDKHKGDIRRMAGEYHGGPKWSPEKSDGLSTTEEYQNKIAELVRQFGPS